MAKPPKKRPPDDAFFQKLRQRAGAAIPRPYIKFLRETGGFDLPYGCFLPASRRGRPYVFYLYEPSEMRREHALVEGSWFRARLPRLMLPIGITGGEDDTLLLDLTPEHYGRVRAWISARPTPGRRRDTLHDVAESFDAYLDSLVLLVQNLSFESPKPRVSAWLETLPAPRPWPGRSVFGDVYRIRR